MSSTRKRSSDILAFVKQMTGSTCQFLDVVSLPASTSLRVLLQRAQLLGLKSNCSSHQNWVFEIVATGSTFDMDTLPTGEAETGTVVIIKTKAGPTPNRDRDKIKEFDKTVSSKGVKVYS